MQVYRGMHAFQACFRAGIFTLCKVFMLAWDLRWRLDGDVWNQSVKYPKVREELLDEKELKRRPLFAPKNHVFWYGVQRGESERLSPEVSSILHASQPFDKEDNTVDTLNEFTSLTLPGCV